MNIDPESGVPATAIGSETVNGCTRHEEGMDAFGSIPVLVWVNIDATLEGGKMYGLLVRNAHADPAHNFFSINLPLADTELAGPHARNELDKNASGGILGLDPRDTSPGRPMVAPSGSTALPTVNTART